MPLFTGSNRRFRYALYVLAGLFLVTLALTGVAQLQDRPETARAAGTVYTVTSLDDSGPGTLREAVDLANNNGGKDTVVFNVTGPLTLASQLDITDSVVINGIDSSSNPACPSSGLPEVEIIYGGGGSAFRFSADSNEIKGINLHKTLNDTSSASTIYNRDTAITFADSSDNVLSCNYLGVGPDGNISSANTTVVRFGYGLAFEGVSTNNLIGGADSGQKNVIGAIQGHGIYLGPDATNNTIQGNYIGLNGAGDESTDTAYSFSFDKNTSFKIRSCGSLPRTDQYTAAGICIRSSNNLIGGDTPLKRNVIVAGDREIIVDINANNNIIQGNYTGLNVAGDTSLRHSRGSAQGVAIYGEQTIIGGLASSEGNRFGNGVTLLPSAVSTTLKGNYVSTNAAGTEKLPNTNTSASTFIASNGNTIGGSGPEEGNIFASRGGYQGLILNSLDVWKNGVGEVLPYTPTSFGANVVQGNHICVDVTGNLPLACSVGIMVASPNNLIGGPRVGEENIIGGSTQAGIRFQNPFPQDDGQPVSVAVKDNQVRGNLIGLGRSETAVANTTGIEMLFNHTVDLDHTGNVIGGSLAGEGNVISGNTEHGIKVSLVEEPVRIQGNKIGTNSSGDETVPNGAHGIYFPSTVISEYNSTGSIIGGQGEFERNIVSGNGQTGVSIKAGNGVIIEGNFIGTDATESIAMGNGTTVDTGAGINKSGIFLATDAHTIRNNLIAANQGHGIELDRSNDNLIQGNYLGTNPELAPDLGNQLSGISVYESDNNLIGGVNPDDSNYIYNNLEDGVSVRGGFGINSIDNSIVNNSITGNDKLGIDLRQTVSAFGDVFERSGITHNDLNDPDEGGNNFLNFPIIRRIEYTETEALIESTYNSAPNTSYRLELYESEINSIPDYRQGKKLIQTTLITTDEEGNAEWNLAIELDYKYKPLTMTATEVVDNPQSQANDERFLNTSEFGCSLVATSSQDSGPGSFRDAVNCANNNPGLDTVMFNLPENDKEITLSRQVNITDAAIINGVDLSYQPTCADNYIPTITLRGVPNSSGLGVAASGSTVVGLHLEGFDGSSSRQAIRIYSNENLILCNFLGTSLDGSQTGLSNNRGIFLSSGNNNVIQRNIVANSTREGIYLNGGSGSVLGSNYVGTNSTLTANLGNGSTGILIRSSGNLVGGVDDSSSNYVGFNGRSGIVVEGSGVNNAILNNATFENERLGIDLSDNQITANDLGDVDEGPNNLQNYPVIDGPNTGGTTVAGMLNSEPDKSYRLEIYANASNFDVTTDREGAEFLQAFDVTTDASGNADWSITIDQSDVGKALTITATEYVENEGNTGPFGLFGNILENRTYFNTSEFGGVAGDGSEPSEPGVEIRKSNNAPTGVAPDEVVTYTLTYENTGDDTLTDVVLTDTLDPNLEYVDNSCTPAGPTNVGCSYDENTRTLTWNIGNMPFGTNEYTAAFEVRVAAQTATSVTMISNEGFINTAEINGRSGDNPVDINHPGPTPDIEITKEHDQTTNPQPGDVVEYTVTYANTGAVTLTGTELTDTLDANFEYIDGSCTNALPADVACTYNENTRTLSWNPGDLPVAQTEYTVSFQVRIGSATPDSVTTITNKAFLNTAELSGETGDVPLTVNHPEPDAGLRLTQDKPDGAGEGEEVTYTVEYENTGEVDLTETTLRNPLDEAFVYVPDSCTGSCVFNETTNTLTWDLGTISTSDPTDQETFRVTIAPDLDDSVTSVENTVYLETNELDREASSLPVPIKRPGLELTKTYDETLAYAPGDRLGYALSYTNNGAVELTEAVLTDTLDENLLFVAGSCTPECTYDEQTRVLTWQIGTIPVGTQTQAYRFAVEINPDIAVPTVANSAFLNTAQINAETNTTSTAITYDTEITNRASREALALEEPVTFTITFENNSNVPLTDVVIRDPVNPELEFVSCSDGCRSVRENGQTELIWNFETIEPNQTQDISFDAVLIDDSVPEITNIAYLTSNEVPAPREGRATLRVDRTETPVIPDNPLPRTGGPAGYMLIGLGTCLLLLLGVSVARQNPR